MPKLVYWWQMGLENGCAEPMARPFWPARPGPLGQKGAVRKKTMGRLLYGGLISRSARLLDGFSPRKLMRQSFRCLGQAGLG